MGTPYTRRTTRKTLWATTSIDGSTVRIYRAHLNKLKCDGVTCRDDKGIWVEVNTDIFDDPEYLAEILIHEMVHVIEYAFSAEFKLPRPPNCTHHANFVGKYLPGLIRNLKQVW